MFIMAFKLYFIALLAFLATITSARDSKDGEFPFQVSIKNLNSEHLCGGVIITSKWVLTSADCANSVVRLEVGYGSTDTQTMERPILSQRIEIQKDFPYASNVLALIELETELPFGRKVKAVKLPKSNVQLVNGTISAWKANALLMNQWTLKAVDTDDLTYVTRDCKGQNGQNLPLAPDQFCLILDSSGYTSLTSIGAALSRGNVLLGFHYKKKLTPLSPIIFVELSHHGQWISDTLQEDSKNIQWADTVPNSAKSKSAITLVVGLSYIFIRYF